MSISLAARPVPQESPISARPLRWQQGALAVAFRLAHAVASCLVMALVVEKARGNLQISGNFMEFSDLPGLD